MDMFDNHINQFNHNKRFLSFGISNTKESFHDWEITVNFYAVIHLIEAILYKECKVTSVCTHEERKNYISANPSVFNSNVRKDYFALQTLARTARYSGYLDVTEKDSLEAQTRRESIEGEMAKYLKWLINRIV